MGRFKYTTEIFIKKSIAVHGDKYGYDKTIYVRRNAKVEITCKTCGRIFWQVAADHMRGIGCAKCAPKARPQNTGMSIDEFLQKAKCVHGDSYDYSCTEYISSKKKVSIRCKACDLIFYQTPNWHLFGGGCPKCGRDRSRIALSDDFDSFLTKARARHGDLYDYSHVLYKNSRTKINIYCKRCNLYFEMIPANHIRGWKCPKCSVEIRAKKRSMGKSEFIRRAFAVHGDNYSYQEVDYKNNRTKIKIYCKQCKTYFYQEAERHLLGGCCPVCVESSRMSLGEIAVERALSTLGIEYETQKTFDTCKRVGLLRFDFFLPKFNTCIEYQGFQHFSPVEQWGGVEKFLVRTECDLIKREWCQSNKVRLIEIRYDCIDIAETLAKELGVAQLPLFLLFVDNQKDQYDAKI